MTDSASATEDAEDFALANGEEFVQMRAAARRDHEDGQSVALSDL